MHLETSCSGLPNVTINRIEEFRLCCTVLWNNCIQNNEADNVIQTWTIHKANELVKTLKIEAKLKWLELKPFSQIEKKRWKSLERLLWKKSKKLLKNSGERYQNSFYKIGKTILEEDERKILHHNISSSLRIHVILEDLDKRHEKLVPTNKNVNKILNKKRLDTKVKEIRGPRKFDTDKQNSGTGLVNFNTENEALLVAGKTLWETIRIQGRDIFLCLCCREKMQTKKICVWRNGGNS